MVATQAPVRAPTPSRNHSRQATRNAISRSSGHAGGPAEVVDAVTPEGHEPHQLDQPVLVGPQYQVVGAAAPQRAADLVALVPGGLAIPIPQLDAVGVDLPLAASLRVGHHQRADVG